ncbi:MAG: sulfatase [Planctomyces sp.]
MLPGSSIVCCGESEDQIVNFLGQTSIAVLRIMICAALCSLPAAAQTEGRPNVVVVFADDWGRYASAYGRLEPGGLSDIVQTPNFDRLAASGVLFTRAFVNAPSCTPCRSSLLSGQYFWRTGRGAILQGAVWDDRIPAFPLLLEKSGYQIGHTAKVWSPGSPGNAPIGAGRTAVKGTGGRFNDYSEALSASEDPGALGEQLLGEVRAGFRTFLQARSPETPFLYWWGPTTTHRTWVRGSGKKLWNIDPERLRGRLPGHLPDVPEVREDVADYLGEVQAVDAGLGAVMEVLEETGQRDNTLVIVSGDHGMPGVPGGKCNLYDTGTRVSLAISWPAAIPAGRVVDDFVSLPDLSPTVLQAAGVAVPEVMTGRDLLPLLRSSLAGLVDETRDHVVIGRERHVAGARPDFLPYPQRALRTADFLYIRNFAPDRWPMGVGPGFGAPEGAWPDSDRLAGNTFAAFADMDASPTKRWVIEQGLKQPEYRVFFERAFAKRPAEELYDLRRDPEQIHNVAGSAEYAGILQAHSERLIRILRESGDPRVMTEPCVFDLPPYAGQPEPAGNGGRGGKAGGRAAGKSDQG